MFSSTLSFICARIENPPISSVKSRNFLFIENAWILTRDKLAPGTVLQKAYGILDKYKLSRTFFVKTDQNSCEIAEAADTSTTSERAHSAAPAPVTPAPSSNTGSRKPVKKTVQKVKGQSGPVSVTSAPAPVPAAIPAATVPAAVPVPASPLGVSTGRDEVSVKPEAATEIKPQNEGEVVTEQKVVTSTSTA